MVNIKFLLFIYFCAFGWFRGLKSATNHTFNVSGNA
jgi:hypothetical protein